MPTTSITAAVVTKYEALTATNFPSSTRPHIDFGEAVQVNSGSQLRPPYVVLRDNGRERTILDFERNSLVTPRYVFEIWANSLGDAQTITTAIRLNGGTVGQGLGFDFGTLTDLTTPKSTHQILPVGEPEYLGEQLDPNGNRAHVVRLEYRLSVLEAA